MSGTQTVGFTLRAGRSEDAETCGSICYEAFKAIADQHNFPPDFPSPEASGGLITSHANLKIQFGGMTINGERS
jgi:hypothetical protein